MSEHDWIPRCTLCEIPITEKRNCELCPGDIVTCQDHEQLVNAIWFDPKVSHNDEAWSLPEAQRLGRSRVDALTRNEIEEL